jgi:hypothetical protein
MSYIASGQFLSDVEAATDEKYEVDEDAIESEEEEEEDESEENESDGDDESDDDESDDDESDEDEDYGYDAFPAALKAEILALAALSERGKVPELLGLRHGDYVPLPWQEGADEDEVLEDWFSGNKKRTKAVMDAVSVLHHGGGFYYVVGPEGRMGVLTEDPYGYTELECTLEAFLKAVVAAHRTVRAEGLAAASALLVDVVGKKTAKTLLMRAEDLVGA